MKFFFVLSFLSSILLAQNESDFKERQFNEFKNQKNEFASYKKSLEDEFKSYEKAQKQAYTEYVKELSLYWDKPKLSDQKHWVSYAKDNKTKTDVDFEKETITIETIASSEDEAKEKFKTALSRVITVDTKKAHEDDELEKKLAKIKAPQSIISGDVDSKPILSVVIFDKEPSQNEINSYVDKNLKENKIYYEKSPKVKDKNVYSLNVDLPKDAMLKRSKVYYEDVKKESQKQNIPVSLVFAIMQCESSFNPRARSHIPAYGLMQIVPQSAGIDSYLFLYNERKVVSSEFLYNSKNNITMGSAYLHILYYKYLAKIEDPYSRLYCTIAAYNTGAGNVAWAFTKTNSVTKAAPIINSISSEEVYVKLLKNLKYNEPKEYLKKVTKMMSSYHKAYEAL